MKKLSISLIALAALALGACTSDDVALNEKAVVSEGGDGYISLAINLPTQTSTRAANDVYDDGIAAEYYVNDVTLYLFEGTSEASAVLSQSYNLTDAFEGYSPANDNITSRMQATQKVTSPSTGSLYALVVVNGAGVSIPTGSTLTTLQNTLTAMDVATIASVSNGGNFFMTNAPLWHGSKGGYTDPTTATAIVSDPGVTTLAEIDKSKIYDTQAQAEANPATEIYVERGVAKVTVDGSNAQSGMTGVDVEVNGFVLDLTNLSGYIVRNTTTSNAWWQYASGTLDGVNAGTNQYRFVGDVEVAADLYRTYWAIDPNYSTALYTSGEEGSRVYPTTVSSLAGTTPTTLVAADGTTGAYCLENTFNVAHQNQDETTRAIVAVTLTVTGAESDGSFYTLEGDKSTLYTAAQVCDEVLSIFAADGDVEAAAKSWQGLESQGNNLYDYYAVTIDTSNGGSSDVTVSIALGDEVDYDEFASYFEGGVVPAILDPTDETGAFAAVVAAINAENEISYYAGGVAYYPVLIKHFGDDLTPWDITGVSGESYPDGTFNTTAEETWLGRYGVLRNNWYDINVTAVNQIGSADIPTAYGEPDDPIESWISVEINILSWAKRTQNVTL